MSLFADISLHPSLLLLLARRPAWSLLCAVCQPWIEPAHFHTHGNKRPHRRVMTHLSMLRLSPDGSVILVDAQNDSGERKQHEFCLANLLEVIKWLFDIIVAFFQKDE